MDYSWSTFSSTWGGGGVAIRWSGTVSCFFVSRVFSLSLGVSQNIRAASQAFWEPQLFTSQVVSWWLKVRVNYLKAADTIMLDATVLSKRKQTIQAHWALFWNQRLSKLISLLRLIYSCRRFHPIPLLSCWLSSNLQFELIGWLCQFQFRVAKCQFFYTEQNPQTKFYPKKSA